MLKPRLKQIVQNEDREWFIVFVSKSPVNEAATKLVKKAYYRLEADFNSKKRERCQFLLTIQLSSSRLKEGDGADLYSTFVVFTRTLQSPHICIICSEFRCCKLETHVVDPSAWEDIDNKVLECIRNTLDRRVQFYEEEVRRHLEYRFMPAWNFSNFFVVKVF